MTYEQTLEYLFSQLPMYQRQGKAAYKANLDNTEALDRYFDHPHRTFKTVHVAGTNGKGSTSHMIASVLQTAGYKVGLYTSPHLQDFRERIRVNGQMMTKEAVVEFVEKHSEVFEQIQPSFFEMTVALAFDYFREQQVDIAVVEVGMGGRLDSTNIISPELSIITNIGLDHTEFLGKDLATIAGEKAGIIKENTPVVIGQTQQETENVFLQKANEKQTAIYFADQVYEIPYTMTTTEGKQSLNVSKDNELVYENLELDLLGSYQKNNLKTALLALDILSEKGWKITSSSIYEGLANVANNTGFQGRWQIVGNNPLIVCDTGHNEDGIAQLLQQIQNTPYKKLHMVFGMVNDKNIETILGMLPTEAEYYFTRANIPRSLDADVLREQAEKHNLNGISFSNVKEAIDAAKAKAEQNDLIFIGGSTFVVADALLDFTSRKKY